MADRLVLVYGDFEQPRHRADGDAGGHGPLWPGRALARRPRRPAGRGLAGARGRPAGADHRLSRPGRGRAQERPRRPARRSSRATGRSTSWSSCSAPTTSSTASRCRWSRSASWSASSSRPSATATAAPALAPPAVLLVAPPPVIEAGCLAEIFEGGAVKSQRLAETYAGVAKQHGVAFLDAGEVIVSSPLDGVHFDADEHAKLGRAVAAALKKMPLRGGIECSRGSTRS